jgi:hypothetical protein
LISDCHWPDQSDTVLNTPLPNLIEIFGPLPSYLLDKWQDRAKFVDEKGHLLEVDFEEEYTMRDFHDRVTQQMLHEMTDEDAVFFEDFIHSMLKYDLSERSSASDLLKHPWLSLTYPLKDKRHPQSEHAGCIAV